MTKEERAAKWDAEFIPCKKHPERRCQRRAYVFHINRVLCSTCIRRISACNRASKWASKFIPCKNHPDRKVGRSCYVTYGGLLCVMCTNKKPSQKAGRKRWRKTPAGILNAKQSFSKWYYLGNGKATRNRYHNSLAGQTARAWYEEKQLHG